MRKIFPKITAVATIILLFSVFFSFQNNAIAENPPATTMAVSPMLQTISLDPGEKYNGSVAISNLEKASEDLTYKVTIGPYSLKKKDGDKDDYGGIDVDERNQHNIMMDWITIDDKGSTLSPGEKNIVNFTITVPKNAPAGAQYASLLFMAIPKEDENTNGVAINTRTQLVSAIVANVAGENIEKGSIIDNSVPSFLLDNKLEATSRVRNDGNVWTNAEYTLQVWPLFSDEEICTNEEKPETSLVLPETERYHVQTCNLPMVGIFKVKQVVSIFGEKSITERTIIVCPVWLIALIFIIIIGIIVWVVIRVRMRKKAERD